MHVQLRPDAAGSKGRHPQLHDHLALTLDLRPDARAWRTRRASRHKQGVGLSPCALCHRRLYSVRYGILPAGGSARRQQADLRGFVWPAYSSFCGTVPRA
jgi:hypothetical protein